MPETPSTLQRHALSEILAGLDARQLGFVLQEYGRRVPDSSGRGPVFWCFDEIQLVPGW